MMKMVTSAGQYLKVHVFSVQLQIKKMFILKHTMIYSLC